jgi:glycosyltransferase involved in cell wall biosynthesis
MERGTRFLLAIPVYNEEEYVLPVVDRAQRFARHILVVNDGSTDGTPDLLARFHCVDVINHPVNTGYGQALTSAFAYAREKGYDYLVTMDCDEQHEPEAIPRFLAEMPHYDIVSGSRYLQAWDNDDPAPPDRRRVNVEVTRLINEITDYHLTDSFCGQKAYRVSSLGRLHLTERGYAMPLELWIQAAAAGLTVKEIPVRRIYKDFSRSFGADLDDAERRLRYYGEVIERAQAEAGLIGRARRAGGCRRC